MRWLGHATTVIEVDGVRLLTDPVLFPQVTPLVHRRSLEVATLDPAHRIDAVPSPTRTTTTSTYVR